jgi:hypothetical protein
MYFFEISFKSIDFLKATTVSQFFGVGNLLCRMAITAAYVFQTWICNVVFS